MNPFLLTRKIPISPTAEQEQVLWDLSEKCRLLYNFALAERQKHWEINRTKPKARRTYITYRKQQNDLPTIKKQHPEYAWVYSKVLQMVLQRLDSDFKSFFARWKRGDTQARPPRFKCKNFFTTLCYNQSGFNINLDNKTIPFAHRHPSGVELLFTLRWFPPHNERVKQVELFQDRQLRWFVAIAIEKDVPDFADNGLYQAIDLGITNLVTAINLHGKFVQIRNSRPDLYWKNKIREVQSRRDHCKITSRRWHFYHRKLQKMRRRCACQLLDFQHKISNKVVKNTRANTLIIGDLAVKTMAQKNHPTSSPQRDQAIRTLNHSLQNTGFLGRFAEFLTYKARKVGKRVVRIAEAYTTKTCCVCGRVRDRKLSERRIHCDCGNPLDRDQNAAVNIMVRFLSPQPPVNGEPLQAFLNGLHRHTALPQIPQVADSMKAPAVMQG
jgi:putative transposase